MNFKKILAWLLGIVLVIFLIAGGLYAIYLRPLMNKMMTTKVVQFDKNLTLVLGGGGNSGILVSDSLVLVVDTKMREGTKILSDEAKQIAGNKPIVIVNTHIHNDHTSGNNLYKGATIIAGGNYDKTFWAADAGAENMPTQWVKDSLVIPMGDETVTILNLGFSAHTQSDVLVYLNNRKLIFTGDVVLNKQCPAMFKKYNASSEGYLHAFDLMLKHFDIKTVVPGHGEIGGPEIIEAFRTFFTDMQTAATDDSKKAELVAKYKDWGQVPFVMSPGATVSYMKGEIEK